MTNEHINSPERHLTLDQAREYFTSESYLFPNEALEAFKRGEFPFKLECLDDRLGGKKGDLTIGYPASGGGVFMDAMGGIQLIAAEHVSDAKDILPEQVEKAVTDVIGRIDFHTDESHIDDPLGCAGCGHAAGAFAHPDVYLQTAKSLAYVKDALLPKVQNGKAMLSVYPGEHAANAVFVIDSLNVGLPTKSPNAQVYVWHRGWQFAILDKIAEKLSIETGIDVNILKDAFRTSATQRMGPTVEKLAKTKPKFIIDGTHAVVPINEEVEAEA